MRTYCLRGLSLFAFPLMLTACANLGKSMREFDAKHTMALATSDVDFYGTKASIFTGENIKPAAAGQKQGLRQVSADLTRLAKFYTAATSSSRAKFLAQLELASYAQQIGFNWISIQSATSKVICSYKFGTLVIRSHPVVFATAHYSKQMSTGFVSVKEILAQAAAYGVDAPRQEKIDALVYWDDQCAIANTTDVSVSPYLDFADDYLTRPPGR